MTYSRPWLSFPDQLAKLKSRGVIVTDDAAALKSLEQFGYYRLSAYWYPFRVREFDARGKLLRVKDEVHPNTHLVDAVHLYLFDKQLRLQVLDALERIEIAIRVDVAHLLGRLDTFAHTQQNQLHKTFANKSKGPGKPTAFDAWTQKRLNLENRSQEDFVKHYREKHGPDLPVWVAAETWDFGAVSQLFAMMKVKHQTQIATQYGVPDWEAFQSWLRSLNYLRNICAHHSRLWNRNMVDQPILPAVGALEWLDKMRASGLTDDELKARPFLILAICRHLVLKLHSGSQWHKRLETHLLALPEMNSDYKVSLQAMGVPENWQDWW
ncbi:Abi family protein [Parathalassolituus penaei]|uniref:Abi family protein n=1 Tax=Parathalassolituus penaei TaxID=2997323 RepID=A0A9X3EGW8_9GAMM|nr:Abi family protein [Parathalassolituus penaei]MCY0967347.1 Abi family protein [Parathalassolituus penaei]